MEAKFKIGDKVQIKKDFNKKEGIFGISIGIINKNKNKKFIVDNVSDHRGGANEDDIYFTYTLKNSLFFWPENILEFFQEKSEIPPKEVANDPTNPKHYKQGKFEVIEVIAEGTKDLVGVQATDTGNVIKYVMRFRYKNGLEDLRKAKWYLDHLISDIEQNGFRK